MQHASAASGGAARPDGKMSRVTRSLYNSVQRQVGQRYMNKKRRQHGKQVIRGERYDIFD